VDGSSTDNLREIFRVIERSVLPRSVVCQSATAQLEFDVFHQRAVLCPRAGNTYAPDDILRREAPRVASILLEGPAGVAAAAHETAAVRDALLRHFGRALAKLAANPGPVKVSVRARTVLHGKLSGVPSFSASELAAAAVPPAELEAEAETAGCVSAFFDQVEPGASDAWLFLRPARLQRSPASAQSERAGYMTQAAQAAEAWRDGLETFEGPLLAVFLGAANENLECIAADTTHIALISKQPLELGALLRSWRQTRGSE
jgi:hypothetical protein